MAQDNTSSSVDQRCRTVGRPWCRGLRKLFGVLFSQLSLLRPVALADFFTTVCTKVLTTGSLIRPLLTGDNRVEVSNDHNILGYLLTPWLGRRMSLKQDYGYFTGSLSQPTNTALSIYLIADTMLGQSIQRCKKHIPYPQRTWQYKRIY